MRYLPRLHDNRVDSLIMFQRDRDPVRIPFEPISPAFEPGLELVGCSCKPPEEAFAARMIRENQDAISHKASRFRLGP